MLAFIEQASLQISEIHLINHVFQNLCDNIYMIFHRLLTHLQYADENTNADDIYDHYKSERGTELVNCIAQQIRGGFQMAYLKDYHSPKRNAILA